jgi:hypothetical protein
VTAISFPVLLRDRGPLSLERDRGRWYEAEPRKGRVLRTTLSQSYEETNEWIDGTVVLLDRARGLQVTIAFRTQDVEPITLDVVRLVLERFARNQSLATFHSSADAIADLLFDGGALRNLSEHAQSPPALEVRVVPGPRSPVEAVVTAIADDRYDYRSPEGIARATGLDLKEVRSILRQQRQNLRTPSIPLERGRELYALASRPMSWRERYAKLRALLTKTLP